MARQIGWSTVQILEWEIKKALKKGSGGSGTTTSTTTSTPYDPDAQTYFTAVEGAGYTFGVGEKDAINIFILGLKSDALWAKILALYIIIGNTLASQKWNAITPIDSDAAFRLITDGSPIHTATGIKCAVLGDVVTTLIVPATDLSLTSHSMGIYIRDNIDGNYYDMGATGAQSVAIYPRNSDTTFSDHPDSGSNRITAANTEARRLWIQTRTSATVHKLFRDGVQIGSTDTDDCTGKSLPTQSIGLGCVMTGLLSGLHGNKEFCFAFVGNAGLNDTEVAAMTARVNTLMVALGRNV
jgi:hypothetical protein